MKRLVCALCHLLLGTAVAFSAESSPSPVGICIGNDVTPVPFDSTTKTYAEGASLKVTGSIERLIVKQGETTLLDTAPTVESELRFASFLAARKATPEMELEVTVKENDSDETLKQKFNLSPASVPECGTAPTKLELEKLQEAVEKLVQAKALPEAPPAESYDENAVLVIDAATGRAQRDLRVKVRRGHYVVLDIRNGWLFDMRHEQSMGEGGGLYVGSPDAQPTANLRRKLRLDPAVVGVVSSTGLTPGVRDVLLAARLRAAVPSIAPRIATSGGRAGAIPADASEVQRTRVGLIEQEVAAMTTGEVLAAAQAEDPVGTKEVLENLQGRRTGWIRAAFREGVFRITVVPYLDREGKPLDFSGSAVGLAPYLSEMSVSLNAQKWGVGSMAGFLFPFTEESEFGYRTIEGDDTHKRIVETSKSEATPYAGAFVNFWQWTRPMLAFSIGLALDTGDQQPVYSVGVSYLFSRHGAVTAGFALTPEKRLPSGVSANAAVPVNDNTLENLDDERKVRPFLGLSWTFGGNRSTGAAETDPTAK